MKIAFSSSLGDGADTHVRTSARWLVARGNIVQIVYPCSTVPDWGIDKSINIHIHTVPIGATHYYAARPGFRSMQLPARLKQFEASLSMSRVLHSINSNDGLDIVEILQGDAYLGIFLLLLNFMALTGYLIPIVKMDQSIIFKLILRGQCY